MSFPCDTCVEASEHRHFRFPTHLAHPEHGKAMLFDCRGFALCRDCGAPWYRAATTRRSCCATKASSRPPSSVGLSYGLAGGELLDDGVGVAGEADKKLRSLSRKFGSPFSITSAGGEPMFFAGLWDCWREGKVDERPIHDLTTTPNELVSKLHTRVPVIVRREHELWTDASVGDDDALRAVYEPFPAEEMRAYVVSTRVNKPANNDEYLIQPCEV